MIKKFNDIITIQNSRAFLFGMLGAAIIFLVAHMVEKPHPILGTVNITAMIDQFIKQETQKNLPSELLRKEVRTYGINLNKELQEFSKKNNMVLLPSEAVISGTEDYTLWILQKMSKVT